MRPLPTAVLLASATIVLPPGLSCQKDQPKKSKQVEKAIWNAYDVRFFCNSAKEAEPVLMWIRAVAGDTAAPRFMDKKGFIIVSATRRQQKQVSDLMDWLDAYQPLRFEVEIQELRGETEELAALRKTAGPILKSFEEHTALLVRASKRPNVILKSHAPRTLTGIASAAIDKPDKKRAKTRLPRLRIGAIPYKDGAFRVRTWGVDSALTTMRKGQTLIVPDEKRGRLLLIRFTKVKATRRPDPVMEAEGRRK